MKPRVYSLETEYALALEGGSRGSNAPTTDEICGVLETCILRRHRHLPCDPTTRSGVRESELVQVCEGNFLANGARVYNDAGHLEWAAPEAARPIEALIWDRAAELELAEAAQAAASPLGVSKVLVVKNNIDYRSGVSYGCHENYSVRPRSASGIDTARRLRRGLVSFLVSRQVLCGAGRVDAQEAPFSGFQLSQRADFFTAVSSVHTREDRPIINLRDEPLAERGTSFRLHLIVGDSNMAECSSYLKMGTTGLLLDMLEDDAELPEIALSDPPGALRSISRDLTFRRSLPLLGGGTTTALEIQRSYWRAALSYVEDRGSTDPEARQVLALWDAMLIGVEQGDSMLEYSLDWAIKRRIYGDILRRLETDWDEFEAWQPVLGSSRDVVWPSTEPAEGWRSWLNRTRTIDGLSLWDLASRQGVAPEQYPRYRRIAGKLRELDIRYHDIAPDSGLFHRWANATPVVQDRAAIEAARRSPPSDTRAAARSFVIDQASDRAGRIHLDWDSIFFLDHDVQIELGDPLAWDLGPLEQQLTRLGVGDPRRQASRSGQRAPEEDPIEIQILGASQSSSGEG